MKRLKRRSERSNNLIGMKKKNKSSICRYDITIRVDDWGDEFRDFPVTVKAASGCMIFCIETGRFLIPHRSNEVWDAYTWGVWGGGVEKGESFVEAATREVFEESGRVVGPSDLERLLQLRTGDFDYCIFLCKVREEFEPKLNWEHDYAQWMDVEDLPIDNLSLGLKRIYEHCLLTSSFGSWGS